MIMKKQEENNFLNAVEERIVVKYIPQSIVYQAVDGIRLWSKRYLFM
jgi:hypothetical protein